MSLLYEVFIGDNIENILNKMLFVANKTSMVVKTKFNGVTLKVKLGDDKTNILTYYFKKLKEKKVVKIKMKRTLKEIYEKVNNHYYESKLKYPSHEIYFKNGKRILEKEGEWRDFKNKYSEDDCKLRREFKRDCKISIGVYLNKKIPEKECSAIYEQVLKESHSGGYYEILNKLETLLNVIKEFI